jgi:two-component system, cell cycle sensor histidine kinase and response regulator CckA
MIKAHEGAAIAAGASAQPVTTQREFSLEDLAFINLMMTTGQVLPSVAHELNNSLQVIGGLVELLTMRGELAPDAADKIGKIGLQAARAAGLLRDLLAFTRRDAATRMVDLRGAIDRAVALRRYHLSRGRIELAMDSRPEEPLLAASDSHSVTQVLVNLVLNAEEAIGLGPVREIRIALGRERASDRAMVYCDIGDSGAGVPAEAASRVGEAFFTTKTSSAAGLGLAVARHLVERDGGRIEFTSGVPARVRVAWPEAVGK